MAMKWPRSVEANWLAIRTFTGAAGAAGAAAGAAGALVGAAPLAAAAGGGAGAGLGAAAGAQATTARSRTSATMRPRRSFIVIFPPVEQAEHLDSVCSLSPWEFRGGQFWSVPPRRSARKAGTERSLPLGR